MLDVISPLYRTLVRPLLFRLDPETAHRLTLAMLSAMPALRLVDDPSQLATTVAGIRFSNPIGLAAGMDKDARAVCAWQTIGFGFVELGTITPRPQPGNPAPRMWRIPSHRGLINRLGFPSEGMDAVAPRIERMRRNSLNIRLGLNFGPNKDTPVERVASDYAALVTRLGAMADFIVVNVSSPNTPGLRNWQSPDRIRELFAAIREASASSAPKPPVFVKIAPDLDDSTIDAICDTALAIDLDGLVVCNTTLKREEVGVRVGYEGGLSGAPLFPIASKLIARVYQRVGSRLAIIGVGGVMNADDAFAHIKAGASLVELYTGLIYEGPALVASIKSGLTHLLRREGFSSISEAVGVAAK